MDFPVVPPSTESSAETLANVLNRPRSERLREYKYRFAQSMVFGLPVVALYYFGPSLGGAEAGRWAGLLQLLLAGWVMYVGLAGMLAEMILRRKWTADGLVALLGMGLYAVAIGQWGAQGVGQGAPSARGTTAVFHYPVAISAVWAGFRWGQMTRRSYSE